MYVFSLCLFVSLFYSSTLHRPTHTHVLFPLPCLPLNHAPVIPQEPASRSSTAEALRSWRTACRCWKTNVTPMTSAGTVVVPRRLFATAPTTSVTCRPISALRRGHFWSRWACWRCSRRPWFLSISRDGCRRWRAEMEDVLGPLVCRFGIIPEWDFILYICIVCQRLRWRNEVLVNRVKRYLLRFNENTARGDPLTWWNIIMLEYELLWSISK